MGCEGCGQGEVKEYIITVPPAVTIGRLCEDCMAIAEAHDEVIGVQEIPG